MFLTKEKIQKILRIQPYYTFVYVTCDMYNEVQLTKMAILMIFP